MAAQAPDAGPRPLRVRRPGLTSGAVLKSVAAAPDIAVPGFALAVIIIVCFLGPAVFHLPDPNGGSITSADLPLFSSGHLLGTDQLGNDLLSRILYGGRASLEISVGANLIGLVLGGTLGTVAGYSGGKVDAVIMRCFDVLLAIPSLILAMVIAESLGPGQLNVTIAISFFAIPAFARLAHSAALRIRQQPYILAARLAGTSRWRILFAHLAPNIAPQLLTFSFISVGIAVVIESGLSFLGLSVRPPAPSWGSMIALGQNYMDVDPVLILAPGIALVATVVSLNLLGDALRARWAQK
jgi:peptide/nickel transport system permease protein